MNKTVMLIWSLVLMAGLIQCTDRYSQGQRIYGALCSNCHGEDGAGLQKLIPGLNQNKLLQDHQKLVCIIKNGVNADSTDEKLSVMPAHKKMTTVELTNLINFLQHHFLQKEDYLSLEEVATYEKNCLTQ